MAEVFKVPAPVCETKRRLKRPASPQPSTSTGPTMNFVEYARNKIWTSVYAHLGENMILNEIAQIRGMKTIRRHGRRRGILNQNYPITISEALRLKEPFLMNEVVIQQGQQMMVTSALDHFANVINHIVDEAEDTTATTVKPPAPSLFQREDMKRLFVDLEDNPDNSDTAKEEEEKTYGPYPPHVETAAAVAAIVLGEKAVNAETDLIVD